MALENRIVNERGLRTAVAIAALLAATIFAIQGMEQDGRGAETGFGRPALAVAANVSRLSAPPSDFSRTSYLRRSNRAEDWLDGRIRRVSEGVAGLERDPDFATLSHRAVALQPEASSANDLAPLSFRVMNFLSIGLAVCGLGVVFWNRPSMGGIRGTNDTPGARRTLVRCVVLLLVLNAADLGFTTFLAPIPDFVELNPLTEPLTKHLPALIAAKVGLIGLGAVLFLALWRYQIAQIASWAAAATYVALTLWWVMYFHTATS